MDLSFDETYRCLFCVVKMATQAMFVDSVRVECQYCGLHAKRQIHAVIICLHISAYSKPEYFLEVLLQS